MDAPYTVAPGGSRELIITYDRASDDVDTIDQATLAINSNAAGQETYNVQIFARHETTLLPPTCVIDVDPGEPYTVGQSITLDATMSEASEGELATNPYVWSLVGPDGSSASLSPDFGDSTTLVPDAGGTYTVGLTVTAQVTGQNVTNDCTVNLFVGQ